LKSQDSLPGEFNTLIDGDIFALHSPIIKPIVRRRNPKYDSDTPRKVVSNYFINAYNFF